MGTIYEKLYKFFVRNKMTLTGNKVQKGKVNYEYWTEKDNLGDYLSFVVYRYMLSRKNLSENSFATYTCHLLGIGSVIAEKPFDAVIWGSGIHTIVKQYLLYRWKNIVKYDIRAVRGPLTQNILLRCGYECQNVKLGDPAVLMPYIYMPNSWTKRYKVSIINHHSIKNELENINNIDICTKDYEHVIDEIVASELIISSSLHGIILAETYGVPAVFVSENGKMYSEIIKYYDWYFATNRTTVVMATTVEEALNVTPMPLPDLSHMQNDLLNSFPYDLWK